MPSTTAAEEKARLRAELTGRERTLSSAALQESDAILFRRLEELPAFAHASTLFLFVGAGQEPDTLPLIRRLHDRGRRVVLPRCLPGHGMACLRYDPERPLVRHPFGMLEPAADSPEVDKSAIDFVLVPALCYDRRGFRLGRGGGYYDRWLAGFRGASAGLCRGCLLQDALPLEAHDRPVQAVVTETGLIFPVSG